MLRACLFIAALVLAAPALAQAPAAAAGGSPASSFTTDQRREIVQILRDALRTDPTILREAVVALQADDQAREQSDLKARLAAHRQMLTASADAPAAGNPDGDVTVVEFYDPRCPYCRRMLPIIRAMLHKDPGLRWVYKDIPVLGPASTLESRAILAAAKQGGYLKMQQALMSDPAEPSAELIGDTAHRIGLDPAKLAADMNSEAVTREINDNLSLSRDLHVEGTPVFVIGDQMIPGAVDQAALEAAISVARKRG
jgi:protein-disulfide isomerase